MNKFLDGLAIIFLMGLFYGSIVVASDFDLQVIEQKVKDDTDK